MEAERSCTQEAAVRHKPKQVARYTCPAQPLVGAHTQARRYHIRSRRRDCVSFCGVDGGWSCGDGHDLWCHTSLVASYAPFDMSPRGML